MKRLAAILLAGVMVFGLAACGGNEDADNSTDTNSGTEATADKADTDSSSKDDKSSDWDSSNDITVVSREDGSGTRGAFVELFGIEEEVDGEKMDMTTEEANITNSTSVMMSSVAQNEYSIGYISLGSLNDTVKALKIDGTEATAENIKAGTYKISRPFNIAVKMQAKLHRIS